MFNKLDIKVLLVDDEEDILSSMEKALKNVVREIVVATDGAEAIELLKNDSNIDLVITDFFMPNKTGGDLINYIITHNTPYIPIILSTAYCDGLEKYGEIDCVSLIPKPFDVYTIYETMSSMIKNADICVVQKGLDKLCGACQEAAKLAKKLRDV